MPERDVRQIIRQWNREIDEEHRRAAQPPADRKWRFVSWFALWVLWLGILVLVVALIRPLHW